MTPFFSIITVVFNRALTIDRAISSLHSQSFRNYEHIIIDGGSTDGTLGILNKYKSENTIIVSEPDKGIYDAINKGINLSKGDFIGLLHSDDFYPNKIILAEVHDQITKQGLDVIYGDAKYLKEGSLTIFRNYRSNDFSYKSLRFGNMLAHTTLFVKRSVYGRVGLYDPNYKIAGDFEFICRLFKDNPKAYYLNKTLMMMADGGISNLNLINRLLLNKEIMSACVKNNIRTNYIFILSRYLKKILQYSNYYLK
jgi:glycosyltransferase involved in cell wall biosynthesis